MTHVSRGELNRKDIVCVDGYGGFAEVLHIEQDGYVPPKPNQPPIPKYLVTVKWGPYNDIAGNAKRTVQVTRKQRVSTLIETFPLGRLRWPNEPQEVDIDTTNEQSMTQTELIARIAELNAQLATT